MSAEQTTVIEATSGGLRRYVGERSLEWPHGRIPETPPSLSDAMANVARLYRELQAQLAEPRVIIGPSSQRPP
ncbi:MAG: hypothetical protein ABI433_19485, partial [Burkholderiaceae bacterium]